MNSNKWGMLKFADIKNCDMVNGDGLRVSLYVTGCVHGCVGCFNSSLMNPNVGEKFTDETMEYIIELLKPEYISGISFLGGDPLYRRNILGVSSIIKEIRNRLPEKDIWLWSGYTLDELSYDQKNIVLSVDMFIDGRYNKDAPTQKPWRGSDNQVQYKIVNRLPVKII